MMLDELIAYLQHEREIVGDDAIVTVGQWEGNYPVTCTIEELPHARMLAGYLELGLKKL